MVAGGFALGYGLNASGLAALVVEAALLMPILAVVCTAMGDTRGYRWYVNCSYRCGHCFIECCGAAISTPPDALAYATNLVKQNDMARIGLILGVVSMVLGYGMLYLIGQMHII